MSCSWPAASSPRPSRRASITPGVTTTDDVAWFIRERFAELGLPIWFQPYVNTQRPGLECSRDNPFCGTTGVILRGDVLHTDVGICYLRLCTDTQEMGYVLKLGEADVPGACESAGHRQPLAGPADRRVRDRTHRQRDPGGGARGGRAEGILSSVYTHPLGFFGHAPGPTIGMWDNQGATPVRGDWPLYPDDRLRHRGQRQGQVPEWDGQLVQIKLEQSAVWDGEAVLYLAGRQTEWHVVR